MVKRKFRELYGWLDNLICRIDFTEVLLTIAFTIIIFLFIVMVIFVIQETNKLETFEVDGKQYTFVGKSKEYVVSSYNIEVGVSKFTVSGNTYEDVHYIKYDDTYNVVNNLEEVKINGTVYKCVNRLSMFDTSKNGCKLMFLDVTINGKVSTVGCVLIGDILYVPYNSEWYEYVVSGNIL